MDVLTGTQRWHHAAEAFHLVHSTCSSCACVADSAAINDMRSIAARDEIQPTSNNNHVHICVANGCSRATVKLVVQHPHPGICPF
jgi:hypothetical protein